jgi:hypothetical protein
MGRMAIVILLFCAPVQARVFVTQQQAVASAFPAGAVVARQTFFLTAPQMEAIRRSAGTQPTSALVIRYEGQKDGRSLGFLYFDTHRVRTEPETVMIQILPDGSIVRVEILSFDEPQDYAPKRRWLEQFSGRRLDRELALDRAIHPMTGASLTGRSILEACRRALAIHQAITAAGSGP